MSEKTEQPTPQRLKEARRKGQVPRSRLLTSAAVTLGALLGLLVSLNDFRARLVGFTQSLWGSSRIDAPTAIQNAVQLLALSAAPILLGAFLGALVSALFLAGFEFHLQAVAFDLKKISPKAGFKKLFSARQFIDLGKSLLVAAVVLLIFFKAVQKAAPGVLRGVGLPGSGALEQAVTPLLNVALSCALVLMALGAGDWLLARRRHIQELMMTREEVKREHKQSEGDPQLKAQRQQRHRQMALAPRARGVQVATAVVVNPTHIAVALRYVPEESEAPYIVARGREQDARELRKTAEGLGIPVVRDIALARSLIHYDVGEEVPEELYQAAAAVLKVALEQGEAGQLEKGGVS